MILRYRIVAVGWHNLQRRAHRRLAMVPELVRQPSWVLPGPAISFAYSHSLNCYLKRQALWWLSALSRAGMETRYASRGRQLTAFFYATYFCRRSITVMIRGNRCRPPPRLPCQSDSWRVVSPPERRQTRKGSPRLTGRPRIGSQLISGQPNTPEHLLSTRQPSAY